jgi:hypothetical protein
MCLEASKCMDVGEGIMSVNTNLLTEEEREFYTISTLKPFRILKVYPPVLGMLFF